VLNAFGHIERITNQQYMKCEELRNGDRRDSSLVASENPEYAAQRKVALSWLTTPYRVASSYGRLPLDEGVLEVAARAWDAGAAASRGNGSC
jgi:hypothetical protein